MGDDSYNPFTAQTYVKHVSPWKAVIVLIVSSLLLVSTMWAVTVFLFSLEKIAP